MDIKVKGSIPPPVNSSSLHERISDSVLGIAWRGVRTEVSPAGGRPEKTAEKHEKNLCKMEMFHSRVQKCAKLPADAKCGEGCEEVRFEQDKMGQAGDNSGFFSAKYLCFTTQAQGRFWLL